ncbi:MAG: hypothetical protein ACKN9T_13155 [Candidatus Methylumidiphilus sp.]
MADLQDVIFLGVNLSGPEERATAILGIAELLDANADEIRHLADNNISAVVKQAVPIADARKYQREILRLGGVCNYRPSTKTVRKLELAPMEATKEQITFTCPACEFKQKLASEADMPTICPQCGIIPSKYDKVAALKEEREKIKRRLLNQHKLQEEQAQALSEQQEMEARRRQIEEELRKELGLPKVLNSRLRLMSSAAFLWLLGLGMGGGGVGLYYQAQHYGAVGLDSAGGANGQAQQAANNPQIPPQQDTLEQVFAFNRGTRSMHQEVSMAGGAAGSAASAAQGGAPGKPVAPPPMPSDPKIARVDAKVLWQDLAKDREWDYFLASQSIKLTDAQQPAKAYRVAEFINSPTLKIKTLGYLAEYFHRVKDIADGENLNNLMLNHINGLPDAMERIESHGLLAMSFWRMGADDRVREQLADAEKLALALPIPAESALGLARVAAYQAQTGRQALADVNFRRVNTITRSLSDKGAMLRAYAKLAAAYAESGNRAVAMAILSETQSGLGQIKDAPGQERLLAEVVDAFVSAGDADSALAAAALAGPAKDRQVYQAVLGLAYAGRLYDAMKGVDKILSPEHKARAAALVGLLQRGQPETAGLAPATLEKAVAAQGQVLNPQDQAIARGEMARYLAHGGYAQMAEEWAKKALASAQSIPSAQERDATLAMLTANLARANQMKLAADAAKLVAAPSMAEGAQGEISKIAHIFGEM